MKIGILGPGRIANTVTQTLIQMKEVELYAVASRDLQKAQEFAAKFGFQKAYGSYEEMLQDPQLELVYITTPHSHHYEQMMLCLEYGKHVLCEKAFTLNAAQAKAVKAKAEEKGLLAAEAIWTRYMPSRKMIDDLISSGIIGKPNTLTGNLSYPISHKTRIMRPELAGGALLDIGIYGLNFAWMHFGNDIERMESAVQMTDTGVDAMETITIFYKDGRMAVLTHSIYSRSDRKGMIHGDKGYMVIENINNPQSISVYDEEDNLLECHKVPDQISGYEYEFLECIDLIEKGENDGVSMPLADTVEMMEVMDSLRRKWGVVYPQEQ